MMAFDKVFGPLTDPTRRKLLTRLRRRPYSVGELAHHLKVSQPAVSQHLAVLRSARLVCSRAEGQRRIYGLDPRGVAALRTYIDRMWTDALASYAKTFEE